MFNILNIIEICNRKEPDWENYIKCADWRERLTARTHAYAYAYGYCIPGVSMFSHVHMHTATIYLRFLSTMLPILDSELVKCHFSFP